MTKLNYFGRFASLLLCQPICSFALSLNVFFLLLPSTDLFIRSSVRPFMLTEYECNIIYQTTICHPPFLLLNFQAHFQIIFLTTNHFYSFVFASWLLLSGCWHLFLSPSPFTALLLSLVPWIDCLWTTLPSCFFSGHLIQRAFVLVVFDSSRNTTTIVSDDSSPSLPPTTTSTPPPLRPLARSLPPTHCHWMLGGRHNFVVHKSLFCQQSFASRSPIQTKMKLYGISIIAFQFSSEFSLWISSSFRPLHCCSFIGCPPFVTVALQDVFIGGHFSCAFTLK